MMPNDSWASTELQKLLTGKIHGHYSVTVNQLNMLWVCIGDFNEITRLSEKSGGSIKGETNALFSGSAWNSAASRILVFRVYHICV